MERLEKKGSWISSIIISRNAEKARHVDDEPYGGGQGMLLRAQPIFDAFDAIEKKNPRVILLDPAGKQFDQAYAEDFGQRRGTDLYLWSLRGV